MWCWASSLLRQNWHCVEALAEALIWCTTEAESENYWYVDEMAELLPDDFYDDPELREMDGKEAEEIIGDALIRYRRVRDTEINTGTSTSAEKS